MARATTAAPGRAGPRFDRATPRRLAPMLATVPRDRRERKPTTAPAPRALKGVWPVSVAENTRATLQQTPIATALEKNLNAVAVTVAVIPAGAVVFPSRPRARDRYGPSERRPS